MVRSTSASARTVAGPGSITSSARASRPRSPGRGASERARSRARSRPRSGSTPFGGSGIRPLSPPHREHRSVRNGKGRRASTPPGCNNTGAHRSHVSSYQVSTACRSARRVSTPGASKAHRGLAPRARRLVEPAGVAERVQQRHAGAGVIDSDAGIPVRVLLRTNLGVVGADAVYSPRTPRSPVCRHPGGPTGGGRAGVVIQTTECS